MLYDAYMPFLDFLQNELQRDITFYELELSDPTFIETPSKVTAFLEDVQKFFPERKILPPHES